MSLSFEETAYIVVSLGRTRGSVTERWESRLKSWIKGHYTKTFNFEIRAMLADVLANNFENIESGKPSKLKIKTIVTLLDDLDHFMHEKVWYFYTLRAFLS